MQILNVETFSNDNLADIFSEHGVLARELPGFECRKGQLEMAKNVAETLSGRSTTLANMLVAEAGTGIGKTLAYLVPAAISKKKIVISTGTLNLQDQILNKEIPFIKKYIAPDLTALCVKGRQNYLCLYRWFQFLAEPQLPFLSDEKQLMLLQDWVEQTRTGDRAELYWLADDSPLWQHISATNTQCLGMHCPDHGSCFINQLRLKAAKTNILIVNHHLFFSDLALRRMGNAEVLPRYEAVVFDEAHHIENIATQYFGINFSHYQLIDLVQDIEKTALEDLSQKQRKPLTQLARALAVQAEIFARIFPDEKGRFPLLTTIESIPEWHHEVENLKQRLIGLYDHLENLATGNDIWIAMQRRCSELLDNLTIITGEMDSAHVYWFERRDKTIALSASPIEVAADLYEYLYKQVNSIIFTSATLSAGGSFTYFKERMGLPDEITTLTIPTPFNYKTRSLLYIPENSFPTPDNRNYWESLQQYVYDLIIASNGRTLVLCTSFKSMYLLYDFLKERLEYPLLAQGKAPKALLLETFQQEIHSVLLAVASFWEGVDVPGEALSCVIIDKLPFEVPSDPVMMARINKIKQEGGNPFFDFQIPRAILTLRQGIGRLMRSPDDRGVLAVMDVRLYTKSYGKLFLKSLPPSPITRDLSQVDVFFKEVTS